MRNYPSVGVQVADILLPQKGIDLHRWATIACDQFTSQPDYWARVEKLVGDSPSTYNLVLPEILLGKPEEEEKIQVIQQEMRRYLAENLLETFTGLIYVERTSLGKTRKGLVLALDLERYDFNKGSQSLIRATEGTIIERLPPRMRIREGAALELPHILVLIDDPSKSVIENVAAKVKTQEPIYDFDLMLGSGHLTGYTVNDLEIEKQVIAGLEKLATQETFQSKYGVSADKGILLFAMGDGNHSLATAKAIWEKVKPVVGMNHPARYALVEIENVHDEGLEFEPIHRVLFGVKKDIHAALREYFGENVAFQTASNSEELVNKVESWRGETQAVGLITSDGLEIAIIDHPTSNLPVGTLQTFLDDICSKCLLEKIDYVHGEDVVVKLGQTAGNCGFYLPSMDKSDLFKTVILDGALPRKTFSMGEAVEKRFYMEARKIL